jgi:response regulator NasT
VLLVSAAEKVNTTLQGLLSGERFHRVSVAETVARASRMLAEQDYDLVIINAPLPDDFGRKLAVDAVTDSERVALLLVRSELYDEISGGMNARGVMVAKRPLDPGVISQMIDAMCSVRERLRSIRKKTQTLEEKMEEIRLVNRAKWALINSLQMTEEDAHRYIQKQAMDLCLSKKETAENILKTYG